MRLALAFLVLFAAAAPASAQDFVSLGRDAGARCLEDAGSGRLALTESRTGSITTTLRAGRGQAEASLRWPPGIHLGCPHVAVAADGSAVVASAVTDYGEPLTLRVATREPGGDFGAPIAVAAPGRGWSLLPAVAAARGGAAVVAWAEAADDGGHQRYRVLAVRRPPGGPFGAPATLVPLHRIADPFGAGLTAVAARMDEAGATSVAWIRGLPRRGRVGSRSAVEVASAAPGAPFGPAQLLERGQDAYALSLAVAPNGRALLAHDGSSGISSYERGVSGGFTRIASYPGTEDAAWPAVALAADGSALVAWRGTNGGVLAATRAGAGPFAAPRKVGEVRATGREGGWTAFAPVVISNAVVVPDGDDVEALRVVAAPGGAAAVGWLDAATATGLPARGTVADLATKETSTAGGPVRDVVAFVPLLAPVGAAWIDNEDAERGGEGRLHVRASAGLPSPEVTVTARRRKLWHAMALPVTVRCSAACDVRAAIAARRSRGMRRDFRDGGTPGPAVATGGRTDAGRLRLLVSPEFSNHIAPPGGGEVTVVVTATAPGGTRATTAVTHVRVDRRRIPPLRRPRHVRAVRRGDDVVVTWRLAKPARRQGYFVVTARHRRPRADPELQLTEGPRGAERRRTRYRMRLTSVPHGHRFARIEVIAQDPPSRSLTVVAPISDGRA